MKIHPKIEKLINVIKVNGINEISNNHKPIINILKKYGATQTEAIITIHLGFSATLENAEKIVYASNVWEKEPLQEIAYQTFLYMNYDPDDPDFSYNPTSIKFPLIPPSKKSEDVD
jgi:hypothetical protein